MRFRKTIKLLPGVKINISKSGISTSLGVNGATVNVKKGRAPRTTVGIPGTGISHTVTHRKTKSSTPMDDSAENKAGSIGLKGWLIAAAVLYFIFKFVTYTQTH